MSTLAKQDPYITTITKLLSLMIDAKLKTYGQDPGIDAWVMAFQYKGILEAEIIEGAKAFICGDFGQDFPSVGTFIRHTLSIREDRERAERIRLEIEAQDAEIDRLRRENALLRYGTETPTKEQIRESTKMVLSLKEMAWESDEDIAAKRILIRKQARGEA